MENTVCTVIGQNACFNIFDVWECIDGVEEAVCEVCSEGGVSGKSLNNCGFY